MSKEVKVVAIVVVMVKVEDKREAVLEEEFPLHMILAHSIMVTNGRIVSTIQMEINFVHRVGKHCINTHNRSKKQCQSFQPRDEKVLSQHPAQGAPSQVESHHFDQIGHGTSYDTGSNRQGNREGPAPGQW